MAERAPAFSLAALMGARLKLALHPRGAMLLRSATGVRSGWRKVSQVRWDHDPSLDADALVAGCAALFADERVAGLPLWVGVGASHSRLFVVAPPPNAARPSDLRAAAALRFQALYGDRDDDWLVTADARLDEPFIASALPRRRLAALQALAAAHRLPLASVEPRFVAAWNLARRKLHRDWLAVVDDGVLTIAATAATPRPRLLGLHAVRLPELGFGRRWLREQVTRVALREGVMPPSHVIGWRERPGDNPPTSVIEMPQLQLVSSEAEAPRARRKVG